MTSNATHDALRALRESNPQPETPSYAALPDTVRARAEHDLASILSRPADLQFQGADLVRDGEVATESTQDPATVIPLARGEKSRWRNRPTALLVAAAAVAAVVFAGLSLPGVRENATPVASADTLFTQAGDAAKAQPDTSSAAMGSRDYQHRVDTFGNAKVTAVTEVEATGQADVKVSAQPTPAPAELSSWLAVVSQWRDASQVTAATTQGQPLTLSEINEQEPTPQAVVDTLRRGWGEDATRGALSLLTLPGLNSGWRAQLFHKLADTPGATVEGDVLPGTGNDAQPVRIGFPNGQLSVVFFPTTGQIAEMHNVVAPGVDTRINAAGLFNCVHVGGLDGPEEISLACADNNHVLTDLTWDSWGAPEAIGRGTAWYNNCDPDCASGVARPFPVEVRASRLQRCGYNLDIYTHIAVTYPGRPADTDPGAPADDSLELTCG